MKINELIEMLKNSKEHLGNVEVYINEFKIIGIDNEGNYIKLITA